MNNLQYENDYMKIFKMNIDEMKNIILPFFAIMIVMYSLEYYNTRYAKTYLESEDAKELYTETFVNACMSMIVAFYMAFSRGRHWKAAVLSIFGLFVGIFLIDTMTEASGFNRYIKKRDYAKLDLDGDGIIDDTVADDFTKEHPFVKTFMYSVLVFVTLYFIIKIISILKCVYFGYADKKGHNHIQNELFWNGNVTPQVGFSLEIVVLIMVSILGTWLRQIFCDKNVHHANISTILFGCVMCIVNHFIFQYVGMYTD